MFFVFDLSKSGSKEDEILSIEVVHNSKKRKANFQKLTFELKHG